MTLQHTSTDPYATSPHATDPYAPHPYATVPPGTVPPASTGPSGDRPRRRPGWAALVLSSAGAAVLASGLSVGAVVALDEPSATTQVGASSNDAPRAPVTGSATEAVDWTVVAEAVSPSVVSIEVTGPAGRGEGSGVVLDSEGRILTNEHVANGGGDQAQIQVVLSDGRVFGDVSVVGLDPATDLAVLQIASPPDDLVPAELGDSDAVVVGQPVMAVGNPLGLSDTVTTGIVSAVNRPVTTGAAQQGDRPGRGAEPVVTNAIQTDAAVNPGNSGGALVDAAGRVVGIPSSIATAPGSSGSIGVGFAIPITEAQRIADELVADGSADHAWLGVALTDGAATADGTTREGAEIAEVTSGTPASEAGLQSGDVVVAVDGEPVSGAESLTAQVRERAPGVEVTLTVVRAGAEAEVAATLGTRPQS